MLAVCLQVAFQQAEKEKMKKKTKKGDQKKREKGFPLANLDLVEMQLGGKLQHISRGCYVAATSLHAAF